jgi:hypothetical protein
MRLVAYAVVGISTALLLIANGCGGKAIGPGPGGSAGSGGSDGAGGSDGTGGTGGSSGVGGSGGSGGSDGTCTGGVNCPIDAGPPGCPSSPPTEKEACENEGLWCEYGTAPNPYCNNLWQCSSFHWQDNSTSGICPPPDSPCPASYKEANDDHSKCAIEGDTCGYAEGTCICSSDPGGLPVTNGPLWSCTPLGKGCPATRPELGDPCSDDGLTCDYGACSGGVEEQCNFRYWGIAMTACEG